VKCGPEIVPRLLEDLAKSGLKSEQIVIISFKDDVIAEVRRLRPDYRANWLTSLKEKNGTLSPTSEEIVTTLKRTQATGLGIGFKEVDESLVRAVEKAGFEFHVWTVDDPAVGVRFSEWGSRSITTNWPKRIREALQAGGE
jgi:glycerophosphoryl diester phosphodiesterase